MIRKEDFAVIKSLNQRGVYLNDIAAELGVHPKPHQVVTRKLRAGQPQQFDARFARNAP
jgi:hypothetical protein